MSTYGPPRPTGGTYYAASHPTRETPDHPNEAPPRPGPYGRPSRPGRYDTATRSGSNAAPARSGLYGAPARSGSNAAPARSGLYGVPARAGLNGVPRSPALNGAPARSGTIDPPRRTADPGPDLGGSAGLEHRQSSKISTGARPPARIHTVPGQRRRKRAAVATEVRARRRVSGVVGVLAVVSVLCIGGGAAAYFFLGGEKPTRELPAAVQSPSAVVTESVTPVVPTPSATKSASGEEEVSGDLSGFRKGDCLTVDEAKDNRVEKATCTAPGAQKVLLRKGGTLDDSACVAVNASFSLSQDASGSAKDFVLCVGPAA